MSAVQASSVLLGAAKVVGARLAARGFKRHRLTFVRQAEQTISLIQLQSSRSSSRTRATYVINYGVVSRALTNTDPSRLIWSECHWRNRVSDAQNAERWFAVGATENPTTVATRVYEIVESDVLPNIDRLQSDAALAALWKGGNGPGLTTAQRLKYLAQLSHRLGDQEEFARSRAALEALGDDPFVVRALSDLAQLEAR